MAKRPAKEMKVYISFILLALAVFRSPAVMVYSSDVCVYGGTSGGVTAAVAAARLGKSVSLISLNNHLGGMSASGLGVTDIGPGNDYSYLGGISLEFYRRVGTNYGSASPVIWFEPKAAERVFWQLATNTTGITVYTNLLLASATVVSNRITQITMQDGTIFRAKQFIDTTYEGDLIAAAGVTFTWGREGTNVYNESLAGIRSPGGTYSYDPYLIPGNPASGLLPLVNAASGGTVGNGDQRLQAYNFRLCLTQNATNKITIAPPPNYAETNYELVRRYITNRVAVDGSVQLNQLIDVQTIIPNGKTDINANGEMSTDYVGYNYTWATNTYAGRAVLRQQHEDYIRGLLYFFANGTGVPLNVRTNMQSWGLAADEFQDTGGWPWQIYVREARRMVSDYVMTQSNCEARVTAPDGICLARYNIDSHGVQRVVSGGLSRWEGSIGGTPPYPYPISYRSIIPRTGECQNVFSTFALSASHVAFASCRMEPVFMMTSHAAGVAAALALDDNVAVQNLNYTKLSAQLRADGQLLSWAAATSATNGIILDQGGPGTTNSGISGWTAGANAGGWNGDYWHDQASGKGTKWVSYTPTLLTNGTYEVYAWWIEASNRATNTPYQIIHPNGTNTVLVNQKVASGGWFKLFTTNFNAGTNGRVIIRNDNTASNTYCIADGIRFLGLGAAALLPPPTIEVVASDAVGRVFGTNRARFAIVRSGDTNPVVTVNYSVGGTAVAGTDYATLPASVTLANGVMSTNLFVTPLGNNLPANQVSVVLNLNSSANYSFTTLTNATVNILDRPVNSWVRANFTSVEQADPSISGDTANPEGDGLPNLMDYALGLSPKVFNTNPFMPSVSSGLLGATFSLSDSAVDVAVTPEWSTNLTTWLSGPAYLQMQTLNDDGTNRTVYWRAMQPTANGFIRFRAQRQ
jgi:FAD dependent oxidoreductase